MPSSYITYNITFTPSVKRLLSRRFGTRRGAARPRNEARPGAFLPIAPGLRWTPSFLFRLLQGRHLLPVRASNLFRDDLVQHGLGQTVLQDQGGIFDTADDSIDGVLIGVQSALLQEEFHRTLACAPTRNHHVFVAADNARPVGEEPILADFRIPQVIDHVDDDARFHLE